MRAILWALLGEIRKNLLLIRSYWFGYTVDTIGYGLLYIAAMFFLGQGEFAHDALEPALIGFLVSYFVLDTLEFMSTGIVEEAELGTLEQIMMGAVSPIWLMVAQVIAVNLKSLVFVLLMALVFIVLFGLQLPLLQPMTLVLLVIILSGVMGFGFLMAGISIVYKDIGSLVSILFNIILFLNGTFIPVDELPILMQRFANTLPTTQGITVMRAVVLDNQLYDVLSNGSLLWLLLNSFMYLVVGIVVYLISQTYAQKQGTLGHY